MEYTIVHQILLANAVLQHCHFLKDEQTLIVTYEMSCVMLKNRMVGQLWYQATARASTARPSPSPVSTLRSVVVQNTSGCYSSIAMSSRLNPV